MLHHHLFLALAVLIGMLHHHLFLALAVLLAAIPKVAIAQVGSRLITQTVYLSSNSPKARYHSRGVLKQQRNEAVNGLPLQSGVYRNGYRRIQIVQNDDRICIRGFFNQDEAIDQIRQEATSAEEQFQTRLHQEVIEQRLQIEKLIQNEDLLNAAIQDGLIPPEQAEILRRFVGHPQDVDQFIMQRANELQQQLQNEIDRRRAEAEQRVREDATISFLATAPVSSDFPNSSFYVVHETSLILLPQNRLRVLFGERDNLQEYVADNASSNPVDPNLQECLSQSPHI
jgi:hypothetical protein